MLAEPHHFSSKNARSSTIPGRAQWWGSSGELLSSLGDRPGLLCSTGAAALPGSGSAGSLGVWRQVLVSEVPILLSRHHCTKDLPLVRLLHTLGFCLRK